MRKVLLAAALAAFVLAVPLTAAASQPGNTTFHSSGTDVPIEDCGSFSVLLSYSHDETITTYYDKTGTPIREQIRFTFSGSVKNSVSGKIAFEQGDYTITTDLTSGESTEVGLVLLIRLPGLGVVTLELGQVTFSQGTTTDVDGPTVLDGGSFYCTLLS